MIFHINDDDGYIRVCSHCACLKQKIKNERFFSSPRFLLALSLTFMCPVSVYRRVYERVCECMGEKKRGKKALARNTQQQLNIVDSLQFFLCSVNAASYSKILK
jgi:hypothetical protein